MLPRSASDTSTEVEKTTQCSQFKTQKNEKQKNKPKPLTHCRYTPMRLFLAPLKPSLSAPASHANRTNQEKPSTRLTPPTTFNKLTPGDTIDEPHSTSTTETLHPIRKSSPTTTPFPKERKSPTKKSIASPDQPQPTMTSETFPSPPTNKNSKLCIPLNQGDNGLTHASLNRSHGVPSTLQSSERRDLPAKRNEECSVLLANCTRGNEKEVGS